MKNKTDTKKNQDSLSGAVGVIRALADDNKLLEIARKAIEDKLVEWRDSRLSEALRHNGLVIRERDGKNSSIIRFGSETAIKVGLKAIAKHLEDGRHV